VKHKQAPIKKHAGVRRLKDLTPPSMYVSVEGPSDPEASLQALQYNIQCALENLLVGRYHNREDRHRIEATIQQVIANAPYPYNTYQVEMSEPSPDNPDGLAFRIHPAE
jgi:uncharacterized iron-regulated protein